jgi:RNA recognition motif-containing protein
LGRLHRFSRSLNVGKKLYVGNLSYTVTSANLEELFSQFGQVRSAQVIEDRDTGRSKGFAFVEMDNDNAARDAIAALHDKEYEGRPLTVNEAKPREDRGGGGRGGYGGRGGGGGGGGGRGGFRR